MHHFRENRPYIYIYIYSGDPEIRPPMGLTESGPFLESVRFVKPANYAWKDTSLFIDMPCYVLIARSIIKLMY